MPFWLHESFFATLASGLLCVYALLRDPRDARNRAFAGFAATFGCISFASLVIFHAPDIETAKFWQLATCWSFMYIPHFLLAFSLHLVQVRAELRSRLVTASAVVCTGFAVLTFSPWFVLGYVRDGPYIKPEYGVVYLVFALYSLVIFLVSIGMMLFRARSSDAYLRSRIHLFLFGLGMSMGLAIASFFLMHVVEYPLTTIGILVGLGFMGFAFLTDRLWGIRNYLRLLAAYVTLGGAILVPIFAVILLAVHHTGGTVHPAMAIVLLAGLLILMWISQGLGRRVRASVSLHDSSLPAARRGQLMEGAQRLVGLPSPEAVGQRLSALLIQGLDTCWAGLYLDRHDGKGLVLRGTAGTYLGVPTSIPAQLPGIDWLFSQARPALATPLEATASRPAPLELAQHMHRWGAEIALPIAEHPERRAVLLVGAMRDDSIFEPPVLDALEALVPQIDSALASAISFQREHLDLQLEHISQLAQVLASELDDGEAPENARALASKLRQLQCGGPPSRRPTELVALVRETVDAFAPRADERGITVDLAVPADAIPGHFDGDQLRRALTNLLGFSLDRAQHHPIQVTVAAKTTTNGEPPLARITLWSDVAVEPWLLPRLFSPSSLDRPGEHLGPGFGLGLPVAERSIRAHGGTLKADSEAGEGTTLVVTLPLDPAVLPSER